jgi:hypothetical protein
MKDDETIDRRRRIRRREDAGREQSVEEDDRI